MISNLNKSAFSDFGCISPNNAPLFSEDSQPEIIQLTQGLCPSFLTKTTATVVCDQGMAVLSCQKENGSFHHFYLDKPVQLKEDIQFTLSAFQHQASVRLGGDVEKLENHPQEDFRIHRQLKLDTLYTFFYQEKEPGFLFPGEAHPVAELTYVDQGSLHSVADGRDFLLRQGELTFYAPGQWHMQYADIGVAPKFLTVSFDPGQYDLSTLYNRKFSLSSPMAELLQQMLHQQDNPDAYSEDMMLCLLTQLLIHLMRSNQGPAAGLKPAHALLGENEIIRRAQQYITANVEQALSVPLVAKNAQVSPSYLTALFQKHLNISPGEYIRRIKLEQSKQLIRSGSMNFTQIAAALQYSTVHHFSRQFKEKFGLTPSEYAKSIR